MEAQPVSAEMAQQVIDSLAETARDHKRSANHHRDKARETRQRIAAIVEYCSQHGIKVVLK